MKSYLLIITTILISSCSTNISKQDNYILTSDLPAGEFVKESGKKLINQSYGFTKIIADSAQFSTTIIIAVHGYDSGGYEWVTSLSQLAEKYTFTYFYRYDWDICPDILGQNLADSLVTLIQDKSSLNKIIIFGHSFGGLVVTYLAGNLDVNIPIEIHTIAAPLAGYPRIMDNCELQYSDKNKITYPLWEANISHYQWRTQKHQDGTFRNLDFDPQDSNFDNSEIILLPETMNGKRLGHNWSITWAINSYLEN